MQSEICKEYLPLSDPSMTLAQWQNYINELAARYGPNAVLETDGGANNVSLVIIRVPTTAEQKETIEKLYRQLQSVAGQLVLWANASESGGWSTHQVKPMRALAADIRKKLKEIK